MNSFSTMRVPSRLPIVPASRHGTPRLQAIGANTQPSTICRLNVGMPNQPPMPPIIAFSSAISAMNEINIAMTFIARCRPSPVPRPAASITLTSVFCMSIFTVPIVSGVSVSGTNSFDIISVPGAVMMTAVSRCFGSMPNAMYAAMMPPEMCAMPDVMTVMSSDCVIFGRYGLIVSGASVWPMKMLAATFSDSAPLAPITLFITTAKSRTTNCMMPR